MTEPKGNSLILCPLGGLGNRIRAVVSGQMLSRQLGWDFYVQWKKKPNCCQKIENLLEALPFPLATEEHDRQGAGLYSQLHERSISELYDLAQNQRTVHAQSGASFYRPGESYKEWAVEAHSLFKEWKPSARILAQKLALPSQTIGIHIRRTDHWRNTQHSPLRLFVRKMDELLQGDPALSFFVCSDSAWSLASLTRRYGARRIHRYEVKAARDNPDAVDQGFLEMLTLASTSSIYSGAYSSFAEVASIWGGIPNRPLGLSKKRPSWNRTPRENLITWDKKEEKWLVKKHVTGVKRHMGAVLAAQTNFLYTPAYQLWPWHKMS